MVKSYRLPLREQVLFANDPDMTWDFLNNEGRLMRSATLHAILDQYPDPPETTDEETEDEGTDA
jgi:hypothetical protein